MKGRQLIMGLGLAAGLALPLSASATNGYFAHGYGTANKALAGAGVALPQDALAPATNPAGIIRLDARIDAGAALFSPRRDYTVASPLPPGFTPTPPLPPGAAFPLAPGSFSSDSEYFLIPHFGYSRPFGENGAVGLAVYGNGGMNTDWPAFSNTGFCPPGTPQSGTYCFGSAGVDYMQLFIAPTYAHQVNDRLALGISPLIAYHRFEAKGITPFGQVSNSPTNLSNNGYDDSWGYGARLGLLFDANDRLSFGFAYQTEVDFDEVDDYAGLFANQGDFDAPANLTAGLSFKTSDRSVLVFDIQHIWYSDIEAINNPMFPAYATCAFRLTPTDPACLGGSNGIGFGWDDMTIYKLGYQWETANDWTWRVGYSYGEQPIPSSEVIFNILAPGVMEHHFTFGFTKKLDSGSQVSLAAMYAPENDVSGPNPLDTSQTIELSMEQFELELSYTWFFE